MVLAQNQISGAYHFLLAGRERGSQGLGSQGSPQAQETHSGYMVGKAFPRGLKQELLRRDAPLQSGLHAVRGMWGDTAAFAPVSYSKSIRLG